MLTKIYNIIDGEGHTSIVIARNQKEAALQIELRNRSVIHIQSAGWLFKLNYTIEEKILFIRQLSLLLSVGLGIIESLSLLKNEQKKLH